MPPKLKTYCNIIKYLEKDPQQSDLHQAINDLCADRDFTARRNGATFLLPTKGSPMRKFIITNTYSDKPSDVNKARSMLLACILDSSYHSLGEIAKLKKVENRLRQEIDVLGYDEKKQSLKLAKNAVVEINSKYIASNEKFCLYNIVSGELTVEERKHEKKGGSSYGYATDLASATNSFAQGVNSAYSGSLPYSGIYGLPQTTVVGGAPGWFMKAGNQESIAKKINVACLYPYFEGKYDVNVDKLNKKCLDISDSIISYMGNSENQLYLKIKNKLMPSPMAAVKLLSFLDNSVLTEWNSTPDTINTTLMSLFVEPIDEKYVEYCEKRTQNRKSIISNINAPNMCDIIRSEYDNDLEGLAMDEINFLLSKAYIIQKFNPKKSMQIVRTVCVSYNKLEPWLCPDKTTPFMKTVGYKCLLLEFITSPAFKYKRDSIENMDNEECDQQIFINEYDYYKRKPNCTKEFSYMKMLNGKTINIPLSTKV